MKDEIVKFLMAEATAMKARARREQLANAVGVVMAAQAVRDRFYEF